MSDSVTGSAWLGLETLCIAAGAEPDDIRKVLTAIQREAVDAFIEKELPGLLRKAGIHGYWEGLHENDLAAKIAELRK